MASLVYLDVDDEITSAAARIRTSPDPRVALVVPYGSRLATSRINFRLLAREAQARDRRLSIVAADSGTRALAASAGLPVFASVGEMEAAETQAASDAAGGAGAGAALAGAPASRNDARVQGRAAAGDRPGSDDAGNGPGAVIPVGVGAGGLVAAGAAAAGETTTSELDATAPIPALGTRREADRAATPAAGASASTPTAGLPVVGRRRTLALPAVGAGGIVIAAVVALALVAAGVAAWLFLPSAEIRIATRTEPIGPVPLEVRADPTADEPNSATATVPAERLTFDVTASDTFPVTGVRVEATKASGRVTFRSKDPISENRIAAGALVATPNGIRFRTTGTAVIPKATIVGLTIVPGEATVGIEAVDAGPRGNVEANSITVIPGGEDPTFTEVRNPQPTSGGTRREFPRVDQADVDAALAALDERLDGEFAAILADPNRTPQGLTLFQETAELEEALPTTDPATLVGQEVTEFTLGLATTGSVIAVDEAPIEAIARTRIAAAVEPGYELVEASVEIVPGAPVVAGGTITFPVTARAEQLRLLDVEALRAQVKGKTIPQARAILEPYGDVDIRAWPDWVTAIPTIDSRVTLTVEAPDDGGSGASPGPRRSPSPRPTATRAPASAEPQGSSGAPAGSSDPGAEGEEPPP